MRLEFIKITTMSVQNSMFVWDLLLIEIPDVLLSLGTRQRVKVYPARVFTGTRVFGRLYVFRFPKDH